MVRIAKKRPFVLFGIVALLIAAVIVAVGSRAQAHKDDMLVLHVFPSQGGGFKFDDDNGDNFGSFFVDGPIKRGNKTIGNFTCWGQAQLNSAGKAIGTWVSQEYLLFDRGAIMTQGTENGGDGRLAVTGGKGKFANVGGELMMIPQEPGHFKAAFALKGEGSD